MVFLELRIIWRLATSPTKFLTGSTIDGVVLRPVSAAGITLGVPPSITATQELVVPKSIPIIFDICFYFSGSDNMIVYFITLSKNFCNGIIRLSGQSFKTFMQGMVIMIADLGIYFLQSLFS